jgi:thymidylate synthase
VNELNALGVHIWDGNAFAEYWRSRARFPGDAGRNYGQQWRDWIAPDGTHIDQLRQVIGTIRTQPASRRMIVTAWNPGEIDATSLPACHALFQFFVAGSRLSLLMYQRSCDLVLGVPFNMAQYAVLLHLVAREVDLTPHEFVHVLADAHVYLDHIEAAREQLEREPFPSPTLWLDPEMRGVDDAVARYRDILARVGRGEAPGPLLDGFAKLLNYQYHPPIKAKMAV